MGHAEVVCIAGPVGPSTWEPSAPSRSVPACAQGDWTSRQAKGDVQCGSRCWLVACMVMQSCRAVSDKARDGQWPSRALPPALDSGICRSLKLMVWFFFFTQSDSAGVAFTGSLLEKGQINERYSWPGGKAEWAGVLRDGGEHSQVTTLITG